MLFAAAASELLPLPTPSSPAQNRLGTGHPTRRRGCGPQRCAWCAPSQPAHNQPIGCPVGTQAAPPLEQHCWPGHDTQPQAWPLQCESFTAPLQYLQRSDAAEVSGHTHLALRQRILGLALAPINAVLRVHGFERVGCSSKQWGGSSRQAVTQCIHMAGGCDSSAAILRSSRRRSNGGASRLAGSSTAARYRSVPLPPSQAGSPLLLTCGAEGDKPKAAALARVLLPHDLGLLHHPKLAKVLQQRGIVRLPWYTAGRGAGEGTSVPQGGDRMSSDGGGSVRWHAGGGRGRQQPSHAQQDSRHCENQNAAGKQAQPPKSVARLTAAAAGRTPAAAL